MLLGVFFGTLGYRSSYTAVLDSRYNHIPLPPFGGKTLFTSRKTKVPNFVLLKRLRECMPNDEVELYNVKEELWVCSLHHMGPPGTDSDGAQDLSPALLDGDSYVEASGGPKEQIFLESQEKRPERSEAGSGTETDMTVGALEGVELGDTETGEVLCLPTCVENDSESRKPETGLTNSTDCGTKPSMLPPMPSFADEEVPQRDKLGSISGRDAADAWVLRYKKSRLPIPTYKADRYSAVHKLTKGFGDGTS